MPQSESSVPPGVHCSSCVNDSNNPPETGSLSYETDHNVLVIYFLRGIIFVDLNNSEIEHCG